MSNSRCLIDTNIIIDHLRIAEEKATSFLLKIENREIDAYISVITEFELLCIKPRDTKQEKAIEGILYLLDSIPLDSRIARKAAEFRRSKQLSMPDSLIAATSDVNDLILVTRDKGYRRVDGLNVDNLTT